MAGITCVLLLSFGAIVCGQIRQATRIPNWPYPSVCAPPNTTMLDPTEPPDTHMPPLPVFPDTFQVRVEGNLVDKQTTVVLEEFYDVLNNRAALHLLQNNSMFYLIFDYTNNQSIYVNNGTCSVEPLSIDDNNKILGLQGAPGNGKFHSYTTKGILQFAKSNGLLYKGKKVVRGIDCDWWQSCMYWPSQYANFTLDYYFSAYNWTSADLYMQIPVMAEVRGVTTVTQGGPFQAGPFHHIYEYFDFRKSIWSDVTVFETPPGVVCPGRVKTKPVPKLPEQFSYIEEIVDINGLSVSQARVYYDHILKLVRFDYRPPFSAAPFYVRDTLVTEIHDYNTGIAYGIDNVRGNCTIYPIQNTTFDASTKISDKDGNQDFHLHMKAPFQMFKLDNTTYTYVGTRTIRGILCDVFISRKTDFKIPGFEDFSSVFEVYFMSQPWVTSGGGTAIPVQLKITTPDWVGYQATYNIYNFVAEATTLDKFEIAPCFGESSKKSFKIEFPGSWDDSLMQYRNLLIHQNTIAVSLTTGVSVLRVQNTQLFVYPDKFYFVATLLERPPNMAFFTKDSGGYSWSQNDKTVSTASIEDCVDQCNAPANHCDEFYYWADRYKCILRPSQRPIVSGSQTNCVHYVRTVKASSLEVPLSKAWISLRNSVIAGNFQLNVNVSGQITNIKAGSIDDSVLQNPARTLSIKALMDQFNVQMNKGIPGYDDMIIAGVSIDDCASQCLGQDMWICNSFEYYFNTGYCLLSKLHPDEHPSAVKNMNMKNTNGAYSARDLYSKKYTVDYEKVPGYTVLSSSDIIYQNIYSADQCAKLCSQYGEFSCKSFDYCDDISTCFLGHTHYYDVPQADRMASPICTHYSRKYIADFKIEKRRRMSTSDVRIISGVSVGQCAKLCVEEETISCASFGYCGNKTECMLSTASMRNVGQVIAEPDLWCDMYSRQTFPDGTPYTSKPTSCVSPTTSKTSVTSGHLASGVTSDVTSPARFISTTGSTSTSTSTGSTTPSKLQSSTTSSFSTSAGRITSRSTTPPKLQSSTTSSFSTSAGRITDNTVSSQNPSTNKPLKYAKSPSSSDKGLSGGSAAGLAIGMVFVGMVVAALVYFGREKLRRKTPQDLTVAFVKAEVQ